MAFVFRSHRHIGNTLWRFRGNEKSTLLKPWCLSYPSAAVWWFPAMASSQASIIPLQTHLENHSSVAGLPPFPHSAFLSLFPTFPPLSFPFPFCFILFFKIDCVFRALLSSLSRNCHFSYTRARSPLLPVLTLPQR